MRVFYVRCSTIEQNEAHQLKMAEEQNAEKVFVDKASGKNTDRPKFQELVRDIKRGIFYVTGIKKTIPKTLLDKGHDLYRIMK